MVILPTGPHKEALIQTPTFFTLTIQNLLPPAALHTHMHTCTVIACREAGNYGKVYLCLAIQFRKKKKSVINRSSIII